MRSRFATTCVLSTILALCSCEAFWRALPKIEGAVTDASLIIGQIESFVGQYFKAHPDAAKEKAVGRVIASSRASLIVAQRSLEGAKDLNQEKYDRAIADFAAAYSELTALVEALEIPGLKVQHPDAALSASPGDFVIPAPEALTLKIE